MLDQSFQTTGNTEFRMRPGSFAEMRTQLLKNMIVPLGLVVAMLFAITIGIGATSSTWIIMLFVLAILGFSVFNAIKKQKVMFYTYRLIVTSEGVQREQQGLPSITIPQEEITRIVKNNLGAFSIIGRNKLNAIIVFAQVERPAELEQQLALLAPVEFRKNSWLQYLLLPLIILVFAVAYGALAIDNIWLSGLALMLFTGTMGWSAVAIYTSRNVEKRIKAFAWMVLIPVLALIIMWFSRWEL